MICLVLSSYTYSFVSDPAVTNLSPDELYAHAKICLETSVNVPIQVLVDVCQILTLPSASVVTITDINRQKIIF